MRKDVLKQFESELSQSKPTVRKHRVEWARRFLEYCEDRPLGQWDKELVDGFIAKLKREKYSDGTRRFAYGVVKRVFDCAKAVHEAERDRLITTVDSQPANGDCPVGAGYQLAIAEMGRRETECSKGREGGEAGSETRGDGGHDTGGERERRSQDGGISGIGLCLWTETGGAGTDMPGILQGWGSLDADSQRGREERPNTGA